MRAPLLSMAALLALAVPALAETARHGDLLIEDARVRAVHGPAPATAAFATIVNTGEAGDRLVSVAAGIAGRAEIHTMDVRDGVMRMRPLPGGLAIPAGGTVTLEPGGLHLMLMRLNARPAIGDEVVLRLEFERAGTVEILAPVVRMRHNR